MAAKSVVALLSVVSRFLELLWAQLLQGGSEAPCGLRLHVLDLYLSELAGVAADEVNSGSWPSARVCVCVGAHGCCSCP